MFFVSLVLCLLGLAVTLVTARGRTYASALIVQPILLIVALISLTDLPLLILSLLLALVCVIAKRCDSTYGVFAGSAVAMTLVAMMMGSVPSLRSVQGQISQQAEFPSEPHSASIPERSDFADQSPVLTKLTFASPMGLNDAIETQSSQRSRQAEGIAFLHREAVEQFISASGFGVGRMAGIPSPHTPLEPGLIVLNDVSYVAETLSAGAVVAPPSDQTLMTFHRGGAIDFAHQASFEFRENAGELAAFESQRFRSMPGLPSARPEENHNWILERLQLVSLLKYETPLVYESPNLPRMDELNEVPKRSLDEFESTALSRLVQGEDLITREAGHRLLTLGSLRATSQCLECHDVRRGTLLGAFSYEFRPTAPRPVAGDRLAGPRSRSNQENPFPSIAALSARPH